MSPKNRPPIWRWQTIASHLIIKITESKENKSIHRLGCVYLNGSEGGSCPPCLSSNYGSDHVVFFERISMAYYYWAVAGVLANVREHIFFQGVWRRTRQLRLTFAKKFGFLIHLKFKIIWSRHSQKRRLLMKPNKYQRRKEQLLRAPWLCTIICFCLHIYLLSPGWISISMAPEVSLLIM